MKAFIKTILFFLLTPTLSFAIPLKDRIETQKAMLKFQDSLWGQAATQSNESFALELGKVPAAQKDEALAFLKSLEDTVPDKIAIPLVYWKILKKKNEEVAQIISYAKLSLALSLRDHVDHPIDGTATSKQRALELLSRLTKNKGLDTYNFFSAYAADMQRENQLLARQSGSEIIKSLKLFFEPVIKEMKSLGISPYSLSYLGFIPGNKVELMSENDRSPERINWVNERIIFSGGKLDLNADYMSVRTHPVWQDPIFKRIVEMIDSAQDSIFINIFLFGGTMGGALAKHLVEKTIAKSQQNPHFYVVFLHDYATNYNMKDEMMPVFKFIKDSISSDPRLKNRFFLLQANIQRHPPGIPFGLTNMVPKTKEVFKEIEKRNTYFESKIDHSKVIVVDPNSDKPKAYFGSKNWTDHSGSYYYDDALYVEGPAAALVQAAYYNDIEAALTTDPKELEWFFYKEDGYDNKHYLSSRNQILEMFKVKRADFPVVSSTSVRIAEANVDGRIKDVRNMLVDRISKAKKNIFMEELFMYDKYINDALTKRKLQMPGLKIYIMADHNGNFGMNGLPNTIFMKEMKDHDIKIRARRTLGIHTKLPNGHEREYHQENHRKIASVDSEYLMVGSSNLNPDTLQGSFREFGAESFDKAVIAKFEKKFIDAWKDDAQTMEIDIDNLQLKVGGADLSADLSKFINDLGATIFRSKDTIEKRH